MPVTQFVRDLNARRIATICPRSNSFRMLGRHNIKCTTLSLFDRMGLLRTHSRRSFEWTLFSGDKGMSRLLEQVPNQVLNAQASAQLQAEPYARSNDPSSLPKWHSPPSTDSSPHLTGAIHTMAKLGGFIGPASVGDLGVNTL